MLNENSLILLHIGSDKQSSVDDEKGGERKNDNSLEICASGCAIASQHV